MLILLDWEGLEPPLPDMAAGVVVPQLAAHVSHQEPVHPAAEVTIVVGPETQVDVIGHQAVTLIASARRELRNRFRIGR